MGAAEDDERDAMGGEFGNWAYVYHLQAAAMTRRRTIACI